MYGVKFVVLLYSYSYFNGEKFLKTENTGNSPAEL